MFVADDIVATVGTINMDYRSLYLHLECGTFMVKVPHHQEYEARLPRHLCPLGADFPSDLEPLVPPAPDLLGLAPSLKPDAMKERNP
jgi:phosphatidylserine/phosphatidylglycerophosphate/cardiolipin synthase-like enzyme